MALVAGKISVIRVMNFPRADLKIFGCNASLFDRFNAWLADTPERQRRGLEYLTEMYAHQAMIFPGASIIQTRHTLLELDVLFVGLDNRIARIVRAHALDPRPIYADCPVSSAIEILAGECARRGIEIGDQVIWSAL